MKVYTVTTFETMGLAAPLMKALSKEGYTTPTPIQAQAIPQLMSGADLLGIAQTGTGKTAAFALPILHALATDPLPPTPRACRVLVLSPTRELAAQIAESFRTYGRFVGTSVAVVFGGASIRNQMRSLERGVDVLVATPGRLMDLMNQRAVRIDRTQILVLDEADQMMDMGFIIPVRKIVASLPKARQTLFFSATMPPAIAKLADEFLNHPVQVSVAPESSTVERVDQELIHTSQAQKSALLTHLITAEGMKRTIVFVRTKHGADKVVQQLDKDGINSAAIHGNKSQPQRERALKAFKSGNMPVLVATDIAARGIDVDGVSHVINFDLPDVPESYVHRIGRTARAGADGKAIAFCGGHERSQLRDIERATRQRIPVRDNPLGAPARSDADPIADTAKRGPRPGGHRGGGGRPQQNSGRPQQAAPRPAGSYDPTKASTKPKRARSRNRPARQA
jgi:ATP-dependent RNA helicase RhlE